MALWRLSAAAQRPWLPWRAACVVILRRAKPALVAADQGEPLPKPRPRRTCAGAVAEAAPGRGADRQAEAEPTAAPNRPCADKRRAGRSQPPPPSACRLALTEAIAIAPSIPDIKGAGGCGGEDLVRLEAVVLPDKRRVAVKPAAILRCTMATAIADWIRTDMAPLAASLGSAQRARQFRFVRMPRPQPRGRRQTVRARPRQCARYSRA